MKIEKMQEDINATNYWDAEILDFRINFFGDEIELIFEDTKDFDYSIKFIHCYKLSYEDTDQLDRSTDRLTRNFTRGQLGYYAHDISISDSSIDEFIDAKLTIAPLFANITFKMMEVNRIPHVESDYFWNKNGA
ncbi:hypothetical protein ACWOFR_04715 [Carnobacterium gallinarum]|uniref:hypothetical protein n=1 Tax=Carnobacterium gallinarum TaxID=2749 RepID=UPI000691564D|nr:hypothetical protein [Carnobacterium gallinarum]